MFKNLNLLLLSSLFASSAYATPNITFNPPLTVNTVEHFMIMDGGSDVTSNYRIQSIAPDAITGYSPAHSSTAIRATQSGSFMITFVSNIDGTTFDSPASYTAAPAYVQLVSGASQSAATGSALAQPIKVQISDGSGNAISGATVTWSITGSGGTFSSPSISDASGIASTTLTMGSTPGTYSITATAGIVSSTDLIQATANPTSNQLSNLIIQTQPSSLAQQNIIFSSQPVLTLTNGSGAAYNIATPVSVSAFKNSSCTAPASGNLGGTTNISSSAGTATFTNLTYSANEAIFLKFSAGSVSVCSNQVSVAQPATAATKLTLNYTPTSSFAQAPFNLLVNVTDNAGNIIVSATSPISLAAFTDATCTTPATGTLSNSLGNAYQGQALFNSLTYSISDNIYIQATSTGLTSVCSSKIAINSNPIYTPASLAFYSTPTSEFSGQLFGTQPFSFVKNSVGSIYQGATSVPITIAAYSDSSCTTAASGTLSGGVLNNSVFGVGAFTNLSYSGSGTIYLGIASPGLTSACSPALTMTGTPANLASQMKFLTAPPSNAVLNTFLTTQPSIEIDDGTGTVVPGIQGYVALNWFTDSSCTTPVSGAGEADARLVNGKAQFSYIGSTSVGVYYLKASFNNIAPACSSAITVTSTACTASQHINLTSYSCDANSKDCSSSILNSSVATQTWSGSSYGLCTVTSCLQNFNNESNSCLSAVAITPATGSVVAGKTLQLTASGGDSTYTWSVDQGTVSSSGLFTAPAGAGTSIVTVKDSHNISATSTITVTSSLGMTPLTSNVVKNGTLQMVVTGGSAPFTYSATGGSVSTTGLFTAGSTLGAATVTVTDNSGSTATSNLNIVLADGSLDPTFTLTGQVLLDLAGLSPGATYLSPQAYDVGSDGGVYVSTSYYLNSAYTTMIVKLNNAGAIDSTFATNGVLLIPSYYQPKIKTLASGGFILAAINYPSPYSTVLRKYTASGALVTSYGTSGSTSFNYAINSSNTTQVVKMRTDSSDNIYIAATDYTGSTTEARVMKVNSSGTILYSKSIYANPSYGFDSSNMGMDSLLSGKMVLSLNIYTSPRTNYLYMIDSTGSLDSTFNGGSSLNLSGTSSVTYTNFGVRSNLDGSVLVFGQQDNSTPYNGIVTKVTSSGVLDSTFGVGGKLTGKFGEISTFNGGVALMDTTGNKMLITAGSGGMGSVNSPMLSRVNMDGSTDTSFNGGTPLNFSTYQTFTLNYLDTLVGIDGKITTISYYYDSSSSKYKTLISRYTSSVTNGPTFTDPNTLVLTEGQTRQFNVVGGTAPYTFSMSSGPGTITSSGMYTPADITADTTATLLVTDSKGATSTFTFGLKRYYLTYNAAQPIFASGDTLSINITGTSPGQSVSITTNNSGGTATLSNGVVTYTSGTTFGVSDTITITDTSGFSKTVTVSVLEPEPVFTPEPIIGSLMAINSGSISTDTQIFVETQNSLGTCFLYSIADGTNNPVLLTSYSGCSSSDQIGLMINYYNGKKYLQVGYNNTYHNFYLNGTSVTPIDTASTSGTRNAQYVFVGDQVYLVNNYASGAAYKLNPDNTVTFVSGANNLFYNSYVTATSKAIQVSSNASSINYIDNTGNYGTLTLPAGYTTQSSDNSQSFRSVGQYIFAGGRNTNSGDVTGIMRLDSTQPNLSPSMTTGTTMPTASFSGQFEYAYFSLPNGVVDSTVPMMFYDYGKLQYLYLINPTANTAITQNVLTDMGTTGQSICASANSQSFNSYSLNGQYFGQAYCSYYNSSTSTYNYARAMYKITTTAITLIGTSIYSGPQASATVAQNDIEIYSSSNPKTGVYDAFLVQTNSTTNQVSFSKFNSATGVFNSFVTLPYPYTYVSVSYSNNQPIFMFTSSYPISGVNSPFRAYTLNNGTPTLLYDSVASSSEGVGYNRVFGYQNGGWIMEAVKTDNTTLFVKDLTTSNLIFTGTFVGGMMGPIFNNLDSRYSLFQSSVGGNAVYQYIDFNNNERQRTLIKESPNTALYTTIVGISSQYYIMKNSSGQTMLYYHPTSP